MANVRTPIRQFASCVLVDSDDTLPSIFSSDMAIGRYVAQKTRYRVSMQVELEVSIVELEVAKYNTQVLCLS